MAVRRSSGVSISGRNGLLDAQDMCTYTLLTLNRVHYSLLDLAVSTGIIFIRQHQYPTEPSSSYLRQIIT